MYSIFADDLCIYSDITPLESCKVINPKLIMADSAAGSLEMTLPPGNAGYDIVERLNTDIIVYENDEEIWRGRILEENLDFWKRKRLYCEGELAFLNDTIQPPKQYLAGDTTILTFLTDMLAIHNSKVGTNRQFQIGVVTVTDGDQVDDSDAIYRYTNYESTLECINTKLVERLGGHLRVRHQNGVRYLDYLKDYPGSTNQEIQFGSNLLDFSTNFTAEEIATVIIPRGERLEESPIEGLEAYLTVESVNDGSIYVISEPAVQQYGRVEAVIDWDNVTDANTLLTKAQKYLVEEQFNEMELEISAFDLHYMNPSIESIHLLDMVHCVSYAHKMPDEAYTDWDNLAVGYELKLNDRVIYEGSLYKVLQEHAKTTELVPSTSYLYFEIISDGKILDKMFPVTKIEIQLDNPSQTTYTMGTKQNLSLTQINNKINNEVLNRIESIPSKSSILDAAQKNAFNILTGTEGGYVSFEKNTNDQITAIKITDHLTETESTKKWLWNQGGLGYMERASINDDWSTVEVAMTMDGKIVADFITAGTMLADRVTGGTLQGVRFVQSGSQGKITIENGWMHCDSNVDAGSAITMSGYEGGRHETLYGSKYMHYSHSDVYVQAETRYVVQAGADKQSDERLKQNIKTISEEKSIKLINNIRPCEYQLKDSPNETRYGFIAQEVKEALNKSNLDDSGMIIQGEYYGLNYQDFIPHLMNYVKDLQTQIDELKKGRTENG